MQYAGLCHDLQFFLNITEMPVSSLYSYRNLHPCEDGKQAARGDEHTTRTAKKTRHAGRKKTAGMGISWLAQPELQLNFLPWGEVKWCKDFIEKFQACGLELGDMSITRTGLLRYPKSVW